MTIQISDLQWKAVLPVLLLVVSGESFLISSQPFAVKRGISEGKVVGRAHTRAACGVVMHESDPRSRRWIERRQAIETLALSTASILAGGGAPADATSSKKVLITGANSGIGYASAELLATKGVEVILGCQTVQKASATRDKIISVVPGAKVRVLQTPLDLRDLAGVSAFAEEVRGGGELSGLLLCAGVDGKKYSRTMDGLEEHISINHVGGFLLTAELRKTLGKNGRIVTMSSSAALDANAGVVMSDINWQKKRYDKRQAYCVSKACCVLFADELSRRGLSACSVDPGPSATQIVRYELPQRAKQRLSMTREQLTRQARQLGLKTPEEAALLPTAFAEGMDGPVQEAFVSGAFYLGAAVPPGVQVPIWSAPLAWRSEEGARSVWEQSVALASGKASPMADFS